MKASLEFNLPKDEAQYNWALMGHDLWSILWSLREDVLRPRLKHGELTPEAREELQKVWDWLIAELNDTTINFDSIP